MNFLLSSQILSIKKFEQKLINAFQSLQNEIIKKSLYMDRFNSANSPEMKRIAIAAYLLYDSLFVLLGGATGLEDPLTWSPLRYNLFRLCGKTWIINL